MTKNQERAILVQIEDLIQSAGADSYIAAAFAGCVDLAKSNIDNDFMNSMQESLTTCRNHLEEEKAARKDAEAAYKLLAQRSTEMGTEIASLKQQIKSEKKKQIPKDLYIDLYMTVDAKESRANREIERISEKLALFADEPGDVAVSHGLKQLHQAYTDRNAARQLITRLEEYEPKM